MRPIHQIKATLCLMALVALTAISSRGVDRSARYMELGLAMVKFRAEGKAGELSALTTIIENERKQLSPVEYAQLLLSLSVELRETANASAADLKLAYETGRRGREAVVDCPVIDQLSMLNRYVWFPSQYQPQFDERSLEAARFEETERLLLTWRKALEEVKATMTLDKPLALSLAPPQGTPEEIALEISRRNAWSRRSWLRSELNGYNQGVGSRKLSYYYTRPGADLSELKGLIEAYLEPEDAVKAWGYVVQGLSSTRQEEGRRVIAKPVTPTLLHAKAAPAAGSAPYLPAVARPSKIRDGFSNRPGQGAVAPSSSGATTPGVESTGSGIGHSGSRSVWPWAVFGLAVLAGGWVWLKSR